MTLKAYDELYSKLRTKDGVNNIYKLDKIGEMEKRDFCS